MKDIEGFEGLYGITKNGQVWSYSTIDLGFTGRGYHKGKFLLLQPDTYGYFAIFLRKNKKAMCFRVHRLVAQAFIPNPENKPCVNHKNGVKTDNRVENLEWCTYKENHTHAVKMGVMNKLKILRGDNHPKAKTNWKEVELMRKMWANGFSVKEIRDRINLSRTNIRDILAYRTWTIK